MPGEEKPARPVPPQGKPDVEFLHSQLQRLQVAYEDLQHLIPQDLLPTGDGPPETSDDEERCARLADQYGFDGSLFRNLFPLHPDHISEDWNVLLCRIEEKIETIPRIIAAIESAGSTPKDSGDNGLVPTPVRYYPKDQGGWSDDPGLLTPEARAILFIKEKSRLPGKCQRRRRLRKPWA